MIFEHTILHEGAPVPQGHKYLLRTDVVFQRYIPPTMASHFPTDSYACLQSRIENLKAGDESYRTHPLYRRMVQYYKVCQPPNQSQRLKVEHLTDDAVQDAADEECHGRVDKSSELYERALSIRQWYREASS